MDIDKLIQRIVLGFYLLEIDGELYEIRSPSFFIRNKAQLLYDTFINSNKYDIFSWPNKQTLDYYSTINNIWNNNYENTLKELYKDLDKLKIELYLKYSISQMRQKFKSDIQNINKNINDLYNKKNYLSFLKLEDFAESIKYQYIICNIVYLNNKLVFNSENIDNIEYRKMDIISQKIMENNLSMQSIKNVAKHSLWRNYWTASKDNIFPPPTINWTDEQIALVNMTRMYDNIREHPECPSEEIIDDDDALDGWMLYQNDKREKEKKKQQIEDRLNLGNKRADEVFLMSHSKEDTKDIYSLNDPNAKANIKEVIATAQKDKTTDWVDLPHIQRQLRQQTNEMIKQKFNKG